MNKQEMFDFEIKLAGIYLAAINNQNTEMNQQDMSIDSFQVMSSGGKSLDCLPAASRQQTNLA